LARSTPPGWYDFLLEKYFRWKYTARNRYATTTAVLKRHVDRLDELDLIRQKLLKIDLADTLGALSLADSIPGLGPAGASGLLALIYPQAFGTVDQFVVKALRQVPGLRHAEAVAAMNAENLTIQDAATLIKILQEKARENCQVLVSGDWTPRKVDMVLWAVERIP
jgi:hypothetical protein